MTDYTSAVLILPAAPGAKETEAHAAVLASERDELQTRINALEVKVGVFRDTNRRLNRRVQLLEGWWQRKVERANYWRNVYMRVWGSKDISIRAVEEAAYQRGYEDGHDERFHLPKRFVKPRKLNAKPLEKQLEERTLFESPSSFEDKP